MRLKASVAPQLCLPLGNVGGGIGVVENRRQGVSELVITAQL